MFLDLKKTALTSLLALLPCALALTMSQRRSTSNVLMSALTLFTGVAGFVYVLSTNALKSFGHPATFESASPFLMGVFPICLSIDPLSAFFLLLLCVQLISLGFFSPSYLAHLSNKVPAAQYWSAFTLFVASMATVVVSADAISFIVAWEIMAFSSAALVASDHIHRDVRRAALIYLGSTRAATAFLAGGFLWMHALTGSWQFSSWSFASHDALIPALLIMLAFCIKAGVWPFHIWLPYAHPAAPATVSALMSGFMIKIAIYALIRILFLGKLDSDFLANLLFGLGVVSAFWGVLFALVQNDLKRLLAYSSIENIGLILVALAVGLKARTANLPEVAILSLTAALFHCFNHGLFKTLLFLSAGSVDTQTHTRDLHKLGGLANRMPFTMVCFFIGSFAICSLPPLNGFASKWILYQSLFLSAFQCSSFVDRGIAIAGICILSMVGGLAVATFAKAMGVVFLGNCRTKLAEQTNESSVANIAAQVFLVSICLLVGVFADRIFPHLVQISTHLSGIQYQFVPQTAEICFPIPTEVVALLLISITLLIQILFLKTSSVRKYSTWDCGFGSVSPRAQVASDSFSQPIARIFGPLLKYKTDIEIIGKDRKHFPETLIVGIRMVSLLETMIYLPAMAVTKSVSKRLIRLQAGSIHLYLMYVCLTLVLLLLIGTRI